MTGVPDRLASALGDRHTPDGIPEALRAALADRYAVERELGAGGMATVWLATELALGRSVALKVVAPHLLHDAGVERFAREMRLAARLQHPNLVPVLASGEDGGVAWFTMPYVKGETLRARLARGPVPLAEARLVLRDMARALAYAHGEGVVHRDIKPENVLLTGDAALVADFGIAKAISAARTAAEGTTPASDATLTQAGTSLGTPAYMAPEQAAGDAVDARADLYAWGVIAWELLAGRHPFAGRTTAQAILVAHLTEAPAPLLERLAPAVRRDADGRALAALVMQCLAKDPAARPSSARTLLDALEGGPGGAHDLPTPSRMRPLAVGAGALAVLGALAGIVLTERHGSAGDAPAASSLSTTPAVRLEPKRVVVATFENRSGDRTLDPIGAMAADWIARGLVGTGVVDVGGTAADLASRGVRESAAPGEPPLITLARTANAGLVVSGAYYLQGDSVYLQADVTDANTRTLLRTIGPVVARRSAPLEGIERLRQRVTGGLAPLVDSTLATYAALTTQPPSLEAYREFLAGEAAFYADEEAAVTHFVRAAVADTTYALPLLRLAVLQSNRGDARAADSVIAVAAARRDRMTVYERAYLDYAGCVIDENERDPDGCLATTEALRQIVPRSQFIAYLHGIMLRSGHRQHAADSVFGRLDPLGGELRGRIHFVAHRASAAHEIGRHAEELAFLDRVAPAYERRLFVVPSRIAALLALDRVAEALALLADSRSWPADTRTTPAFIGARTLEELRWHGHARVADSLAPMLLAQEDSVARPLPAHERLQRRAELLLAMRDWPELAAAADTLLRLRPRHVFALRQRGVALAKLGRVAEARAIEAELARDTAPTRPGECPQGTLTGCRRLARAFILAALGDGARAVSLLQYRGMLNRMHHFDYLGEALRDAPAFQAFAKPRG